MAVMQLTQENIESTINDQSFTERAPKLGGLVEFYRSPDRVMWSPTGVNVPDYPKLAQLWWQNIGEAVSGEVTVDTAMDNLAKEMDRVLERIAAVEADVGRHARPHPASPASPGPARPPPRSASPGPGCRSDNPGCWGPAGAPPGPGPEFRPPG